MADVEALLVWSGRGLVFEGRAGAAPAVTVDGDGTVGSSPMQTLLFALAGCMAADVVDILGKMRAPLSGLRVRIEGDRAADPPRRYTRIVIAFEAEGLGPSDRFRLDRAIDLSRETYCSVLHTLRPDLELRLEARLLD